MFEFKILEIEAFERCWELRNKSSFLGQFGIRENIDTTSPFDSHQIGVLAVINLGIDKENV